MITKVSHATIWVTDQDRAKDFYVNKLGFECRDDAKMGPFRWLTVSPKSQSDLRVILMPIGASPMMTEEQAASLRKLVESGAMGGGVLATDDLNRDYEALKAKGVEFVRPPTKEPYGYASVFKDDSGNYWSFGEES